ncbi:SubName: Full=Related to IVY1-phospholipid-binding protein {ECO:0000313/EMBL:CCA68894.1} [Serendipita indica DSM 11827]|uniref:Related to IVY1-phospholipid-binding protein n=1 Tax=Serendipita indica (strain DSM 11827) TaxID=1109443 RepID=G4TC63_SERID|nr:SubName: Full=Related to IVY1-phospholipid-binding protein {ECO:0000313/EMBL:CCA68894.1} [Serendipita indica DSM 11827]CCA68894.1 related to IVY1-phospholipid-binding protein [Serendipita indica DSM 11827]
MSKRRSGSAIRARTSSNASTSSMPSGPPSPTFSATTNASQVNLDVGPDTIITRRDLRQSINAYEDLVSDCRQYREALSLLSNATSRFATTLERCSRLKGVEDSAAIGLQAYGGFHHLMGNYWQILNSTILTSFEDPLSSELNAYKRVVSDRSAAYERMLLEKSKVIKQTEAESISTGRRKQRDLQAFKKTLSALQAHVDDLDRLKAAHYQSILEHEAKVWDVVLDKTGLVVRSSLDIFERLSAKASDPTLEPLMQSVLDPFDAYGPVKSENEIFSILPPLSILTNPHKSLRGPSPSPPVNGHRASGSGFYSVSDSLPASSNWADASVNAWSQPQSGSAYSSTTSLDHYTSHSPPRRPSSPPSTSTLRTTTNKPRPSISNLEDAASTSATETTDLPTTRRDSSRRDTVLTLRPPPPEPFNTENADDTMRISNQLHSERNESTSALPTPKKSGFSFSRLMGSSSSNTHGVTGPD